MFHNDFYKIMLTIFIFIIGVKNIKQLSASVLNKDLLNIIKHTF